jgi:type I restriction enzyme S subunit
MPWIMIGDALPNSKYITSTKKRILKSSVPRSRIVRPGAFLLTNSMSFGRPYISKITGCIHDGWLVLEKKSDDVDEGYFYHLLGSPALRLQFESLAAGATVKNLNKELVARVSVALPSLGEQRRIAAILDKAQELRTKRYAALALLDQLPQAIFLEMFGDPRQMDAKYGSRALSELLLQPMRSGAYYQQDAYTSEGGIEMVHMSDAFCGTLTRGGLKRVNASSSDVQKYSLLPSDLLIARRSLNFEGAAKACRVPAADEPLIFESSLIRLRADPMLLAREFLFQYINSPLVRRDRIEPRISRSTISGINQANLGSVAVPIPPLQLQLRFAGRVEAIQRAQSLHRFALASSEVLLASLQEGEFSIGPRETAHG